MGESPLAEEMNLHSNPPMHGFDVGSYTILSGEAPSHG